MALPYTIGDVDLREFLASAYSELSEEDRASLEVRILSHQMFLPTTSSDTVTDVFSGKLSLLHDPIENVQSKITGIKNVCSNLQLASLAPSVVDCAVR